MKKAACLLSLVILFATISEVSAQGRGGSNIVNIGVGANSPGYYGNKYYRGYYTDRFGPAPVISLSLDHKIKEVGPGDLSLGGIVAFGSRRHQYSKNGVHYTFSSNMFVAGVRVAFFPELTRGEDWDAYLALGVGFGMTTGSDDYYTKTGTYYVYDRTETFPYASFVLGGHYYFSDGFGMFVELGADVSNAKIGVSFKF